MTPKSISYSLTHFYCKIIFPSLNSPVISSAYLTQFSKLLLGISSALTHFSYFITKIIVNSVILMFHQIHLKYAIYDVYKFAEIW